MHEGRATFLIGDKYLDFCEGDVCILTPTEPHRAFFPVKCTCSWLHFDIPKLLAHAAGDSSLADVDAYRGPGFVNVFRGSEYPDMTKIVLAMIKEFDRRPPFFKDSLRALLMELLVLLHRLSREGDPHFPSGKAVSTTAHGAIERISPAITYIHLHYQDKIDMESLAARAFMSPSNFRAVFNRCLGCSPHEYLTSYRVVAAQALLQDGVHGVEQTALECGFGDPSAFRRAFKKRLGQSPVSVRVGSRRKMRGR